MWPLTKPKSRFEFLNAGSLIDRDLELVEPQPRYIEEVLDACRHPQTSSDAPDLARVTRHGLQGFLEAAPSGRHLGDAGRQHVPSYHFWMRLNGSNPPIRMAGTIGLRIGDTPNLRNYVGHIGYNVYPPARGQHLAERASRLLFPLARRHGLNTLWITCNPDNTASRRTCERLGGILIDTVAVPTDHELYARGEFTKCRYRVDL